MWRCSSGGSLAHPQSDSLVYRTQITDTITDHSLRYCWQSQTKETESLLNRFQLPEAYTHVYAESGSFGSWLRHLPLLAEGSSVYLYNGELKRNQQAHAAVVAIDVGKRDLQQCADAVIRLRAEYLFSRGLYNAIAFDYTSGDRIDYSSWCNGERLNVTGNKVSRSKTNQRNDPRDYKTFRFFMDNVFQYAGTLSLSKELKSVPISEMQIGDVFIKGGSPGHACIVADMIVNVKGEKQFLLIQSYMPAQQMHILRNPNLNGLIPFYPLQFGTELRTPEWVFTSDQLKRFK
jgi:hypothetical protein